MLNTIFTKRNLIQICKWNKWFLYKLIIICLVLLLAKFYYLIQTFFINNFKFSSLDYAFSLFYIYIERESSYIQCKSLLILHHLIIFYYINILKILLLDYTFSLFLTHTKFHINQILFTSLMYILILDV